MANRFLSNIRINDAYTFPASDGSNGQFIKTDGSGNLSFADPSASSSASVIYRDNFTGDGSTVVFDLQNSLTTEDQSFIYIDGVYQEKDTYSLSSTQITFTTAPISGHSIEVISIAGINTGPTVIYQDNFTGNGSSTDFTLAQVIDNEVKTFVFLNGVYQFKGTYTVDSTTLSFDTAPSNGVDIEVISIASAVQTDSLEAGAVIIPVKNTHTASIAKGTPVYITGNVGSSERLQIAPADASNSAKMPAAGLLLTTLAVNAEGYVITGGYLRNLTTDTIDGTSTSSNDTVYVKAGGGLTMTKPTGSNLIQNIAKVARSASANAGSLLVSSILRTNDVPNITNDYFWLGNSSGVATPTEFTSSVRGLISTSGNAISYNSSTGVITSNYEESPTFTGNVTISGNLTVDGTQTILNTQTVEVEDNILQLNTTQGSPDTATATTSGISVYRGDGVTQASFIFDDGDDTWDLTNNLAVAGKILVGTGATAAASLNAYTQTVSTNLYSALRVIENSTASSYWDIGATGGASTLLNFYHNSNTTPKLTINSLGNIGVGVTPESWGTAGDTQVIRISTMSSISEAFDGTQLASNFYYDGSGDKYIQSDFASSLLQIDGEFRFRNASSGTADGSITWNERMRIDSSGSVGIGVTPSNWANLYGIKALDLSTGGAIWGTNSTLELANNLYYDTADVFKYKASGIANFIALNSNGIVFSNAPSGTAGSNATLTERMRIDSSGNVMMGKNSQSGNAALTVKSMAGGNTGLILIEGDTTNDGHGLYATTDNKFVITRFTNGSYSDNFVMDSSGNVGIGVSPYSFAQLHIYDTSDIYIALQKGTANGYVINDGTNISLASDQGSTGKKLLVNRNAPDNSLIINSSGNTTFSGDVTIGNNASIKSIGSIRIDIDEDNNSTGRAFLVRNNGGTNTLFKIQEDGNVGINYTGPFNQVSGTETTLAISNSNVACLYLNNTAAGGHNHILFSGTGGALSFYDKNRADYNMVINSSGNVGIQNTSPNATLEIGTPGGAFPGSPGSVNRLFIAPYSNTGGPYKFIGRTVSGSSDFLDMYYGSSHIISYGLDGKIGINTNSPRNKLDVYGIITQEYSYAYEIKQGSTEKYYYSNGASYNAFNAGVLGIGTTSDPIQLATNNSVRMSILNSGEFCIGTTETAVISTDLVHSIGQVTRQTLNSSYWARLVMQERTGNWISFVNGNGVHFGTIAVSGSGVSYGSNSDYRLKENVVEMTGALDRLTQLKPIRFNFIIDADKTVDGFLAHEVQDIVPEAVTGEQDGTITTGNIINNNGTILEKNVIKPETLEKGTSFEAISIQPKYQQLDPAKLVPLLVGAMKELKAEIETLKLQING